MKNMSRQETYLYKKTVLRSRYRRWGMVFLLVLLAPVLTCALWPGGRDGVEGWGADSLESRITVTVDNGGNGISLSMEEYLCGALPAVIPAEYEPECLKAQAILMRTGIIGEYRRQMEQGSDRLLEPAEAYLTGEERRRRWGSAFGEKDQKIRDAVASTKGIYLTSGGSPITACYFRVSAGRTRNGEEALNRELPYLISVECPKDYLSEAYLTDLEFSNKELEKLLDGEIAETERDSAGYCRKVFLKKKEGGDLCAVSAQWLRCRLGLHSTNFTVSAGAGKTLFTVKGLGHGVGMSQYAANEMAKEGKDCIAILSYFFQNIAMDKYE